MRPVLRLCLIVVLALMPMGLASAAVIHDELFDGDLPGSVASAPLFQLSPGSNKIRTATGPAADDRFDAYEVALPAGGELVGIVIDGYDPGRAGNTTGFTLLTAAGANVGGLVVDPSDVGRNVLVNFQSFIAVEGLRFSVVESDARAQLQADFVVTPIPAAAGLFATGLAALAVARWRRGRRVTRLS